MKSFGGGGFGGGGGAGGGGLAFGGVAAPVPAAPLVTNDRQGQSAPKLILRTEFPETWIWTSKESRYFYFSS